MNQDASEELKTMQKLIQKYGQSSTPSREPHHSCTRGYRKDPL